MWARWSRASKSKRSPALQDTGKVPENWHQLTVGVAHRLRIHNSVRWRDSSGLRISEYRLLSTTAAVTSAGQVGSKITPATWKTGLWNGGGFACQWSDERRGLRA